MVSERVLNLAKKIELDSRRLMSSVPVIARVGAPEMVRRGDKLVDDINRLRRLIEVENA